MEIRTKIIAVAGKWSQMQTKLLQFYNYILIEIICDHMDLSHIVIE